MIWGHFWRLSPTFCFLPFGYSSKTLACTFLLCMAIHLWEVEHCHWKRKTLWLCKTYCSSPTHSLMITLDLNPALRSDWYGIFHSCRVALCSCITISPNKTILHEPKCENGNSPLLECGMLFIISWFYHYHLQIWINKI